VVTFLFTDVEGSTRRWEADADAMRVALAAHDLVLRGVIEAHGGWLFKHTGDGMCAAFASPRWVVDAAVVVALSLAGSGGEAMDSADGLIEAAEATGNPDWLAWALGAYSLAFRDADPVGALNAHRRGLAIAQDSGNRANASALAVFLARLEAEHGDTVSAFDHLTPAIRNFHNSGDTTAIRIPLAVLVVLFDRLGRYEPAATIAGFALSPFSAAGVPEITTAITHLRDILGEAIYESLAHKGETMTTAAIAMYAYDQIEQARAELEHPG
jgi:hypothetical protein